MVTMKPLFLPALLFIAMAGLGVSDAMGSPPADEKLQVQPAASGSLTGTVTVNKDLYNLDGVSVILFNSGWGQTGKPSNQVRVSADRIDYAFPAVAPGSYYVKFYISVQNRNPPNYYHYYWRYYLDSPSEAGATPVVVADGDTTADVNFFLEHLPPAGAIQCTVGYQHFPGNQDWAYVDLYDTDWNPMLLQGTGIYSFADLIPDVPPGDYYARFDVWAEDCREGLPQNCYFPYVPEYYDNSLTREGAVKIHVAASETTVLKPVWIETDYFICVTTSPKPFDVQVDEWTQWAPVFVKWKAGETHRIGVAEYVEEPGVGRYYFDYWKHGGPRIQNYTIPAGTKKDTLVARHVLKLRLDIQSDHGHPSGAGWTRAWSDTLIGIENAVVEKIPPHSFPAKALVQADTDSVKYAFDHWEGTGAGSYTGTDNPATVTMNAPIREKAFWKTQFRLVVQVPDTSLGSVAVDPPGLWQDRGDTVLLRAQPKPGFTFSGWEGDLDGTADTDSVVMDTTKTVTARFVSAATDHRPGSFDLVSPAEGFVYGDTTESLTFFWRTSENKDALNGDTIRYAFCFGREGADLDTLSVETDTSFAWPGPDLPENGEYRWKVLALDLGRNAEWSVSERKLSVSILSGVEDGKRMPTEFGLSRNYPNPFNPSTEIRYTVPHKDRVRIEIYDPAGKKIRTLVDWEKPAGEYTTVWDGVDDSGRPVGSGIYICRMTAGKFAKSMKMTLMK